MGADGLPRPPVLLVLLAQGVEAGLAEGAAVRADWGGLAWGGGAPMERRRHVWMGHVTGGMWGGGVRAHSNNIAVGGEWGEGMQDEHVQHRKSHP